MLIYWKPSVFQHYVKYDIVVHTIFNNRYLGSQTWFLVKTGTACCKRFDAKKRIYTYLGTNCTWTTLTDFCWKFVGAI